MPVPEYAANLRAMVAHLRAAGVPAIVLISPPPIHEPSRIVHVQNVRALAEGLVGLARRECGLR